MRVAQTGTPRTKFFVPSMGSMIQRRGPWPGGLELLTLDGVARPGALQLQSDQLLGGAVGVGDGGEVRLALDDEVGGTEARHRHPLDGIRQDVGQTEVVVVGGHRVNLAASGTSGGADAETVCRCGSVLLGRAPAAEQAAEGLEP